MLKNNLKVLESQNEKTLTKWWCLLNCWEWPKELKRKKNTKKEKKICLSEITEIMSWIGTKISFKKCLRQWNKKNMNDKEFEIWWKENDLSIKNMFTNIEESK